MSSPKGCFYLGGGGAAREFLADATAAAGSFDSANRFHIESTLVLAEAGSTSRRATWDAVSAALRPTVLVPPDTPLNHHFLE